MKTSFGAKAKASLPGHSRLRAFTMTEMIVAVGLFSLLIVVMLSAHLASLRFTEYVRPKVQNSQYAREALGPLIDEVRSATSVQVGTGTLTSFTAVGLTRPQAGNALKIFPTTNLTQFIYYFRDATNALKKIPLNDSNAVIIVATGITNTTLFTMETFGGRVLTNDQNSSVMSVLLQMRRDSAVSGAFDFYQVRTKVTRRNIL